MFRMNNSFLFLCFISLLCIYFIIQFGLIVSTTSAYRTLSASGSSASIDPDNIDCNATTDLIIEVGVNLNESAHIAGLQMWRDYIAEKGGLCNTTGITDGTTCTTRYPACLKIVSFEGDTNDDIDTDILNWINEIGTGSTGAAFIISPYGAKAIDKLLEATQNSLPIISPMPYTVKSTSSSKVISPIPPTSSLLKGMVDLISKRYSASKVVILGDSTVSTSIDDLASELITLLTAEKITVDMQRCSNYVNDLTPEITCTSKEQCNNDNSECVYPKMLLGEHDDFNNNEVMTKWIRYLKSTNPDVVVLACDKHCNDIMRVMQLEEYSPPAAMGFLYENIIIDPMKEGQDTSNWHYISTFIPEAGYGKHGYYMGTSKEVAAIIDEKYYKYNSPMIYPKGMDKLNGNYRYYAEGIAMGLFIQRIFEMKLTSDGVSNSYASNMINKIKQQFGIKSTSSSYELCESSNVRDCLPFNTFFGNMYFPESQVNYNKSGLVAQVVQREDNNGKITVNSTILGPLDVPFCQKDGSSTQTCTGNNDGCSCKPIHPAVWNYLREIHDNYMTPGSALGVVFIILGVLQILIELFLVVNLVRQNKYWDTVCAPYVTMLYPFLSIMLALYAVVQVGEPSQSLCSFRNYVEYCCILLVTVFMVLSTTEELLRMKRQEPSKAFYRVEILLYLFSVLIVSLIGTCTYLVKPVTTIDLTRGTRPYYDTICEEHDEMYVFKVEMGCAIIIAGYVIYQSRHLASFFFRGLQYYFVIVSMLFFITSVVNEVIGTEDKIYYILAFVFNWIWSWAFFYPFMRPNKLMEDKKISQILLKKKFVKTKMRELLDNKMTSHLFAVFLSSKENYAQYIDLYLDIEKHKLISDPAALREDEKSLFATYLSGGSAKELEILDSNMTAKINTEMGKGNCNAFNELQTAIVNHFISKNLYEEFLNSDYYWLIDETTGIIHGYKRLSIKTLEGVLEDLIVSITIQETDPAVLKQHVAHYNNSLQNRTTRNGSSYSKSVDKSRPSDIHQSHIAVDLSANNNANGANKNRSFNDSTLFSSEVNNVSEKLDSDRDGAKKSMSDSMNKVSGTSGASMKEDSSKMDSSRGDSSKSEAKSSDLKSDVKSDVKSDTKPATTTPATTTPATTTPATTTPATKTDTKPAAKVETAKPAAKPATDASTPTTSGTKPAETKTSELPKK